MSKSMPITACLECPCLRAFDEENRYACQNGEIYTEIEDAEKIPKWCLLPNAENNKAIKNYKAEFECVYEKLKAEEELSKHYREERDREKASAFYWQNLHDKTVTELTVKLNDANEIINQRYIDEKQIVWTIPTPEAYAIACKTIDKIRASLELVKTQLRWKWIDAKETTPKEDEIIVLLMDNGRIDVGYKSRKGYYVSHGFMIVNEVMHWIPLPTMPSE